jgi:pyruvate/2-oxoglutarate dehydrogenase complex dihydrolipoamide acyltransferase (E2) component
MPTKITVPLLGEGVEEVTIVNWLKNEGDQVEEYEGILEVETDKVVTEIVSPSTGTLLKIEIPEAGAAVPVGTVLAWIGTAGESVPEGDTALEAKARQKTAEAEPAPKAAATPKRSPAKSVDPRASGFISPVVARMASEHSINLSQLNGTGRAGRITKNDILAFIENPSHTDLPSGNLIPHSLTRKRIAEHMLASIRTSAHVTTVMEADLSRVIAHRSAHKVDYARDGVRLTFTAYFVSAAAAALKAYPMVNSTWHEEGLLLHPEVNIGMATDLGEEGLIVPVIKRADELSLLEIARTVNDLAERARNRKLTAGDVQGGTFSITNHGISGSLFATPIINQPQCAILGVGSLEKRVIVISDEAGNDAIAIRPMLYLTLTFDHRILDGAMADHFLAKVVELLGNW